MSYQGLILWSTRVWSYDLPFQKVHISAEIRIFGKCFWEGLILWSISLFRGCDLMIYHPSRSAETSVKQTHMIYLLWGGGVTLWSTSFLNVCCFCYFLLLICFLLLIWLLLLLLLLLLRLFLLIFILLVLPSSLLIICLLLDLPLLSTLKQQKEEKEIKKENKERKQKEPREDITYRNKEGK